MDKKQKEALIITLAEKGETYREITKKAGVSPNTIKAVLNRAGLDESTSMHSRAFHPNFDAIEINSNNTNSALYPHYFIVSRS